MGSKVYFSDMRSTKTDENITRKVMRLFDSAALNEIIYKGDLVAIKIHFGTGENHRHIRPEHVRAVVEKVQEVGGKPFVTETTGVGLATSRGTAVGCIKTATMHGFAQETLGAPIIVADGLKGLSGVRVKIKGLRMKVVEIAQAIAEADAMISIAHAKGHPRTGFAATLKNIGLGCVTKTTKAQIHLAKKPIIKQDLCNDCGTCITFCPVGAIRCSKGGKLQINHKECIWGCGCWDLCPQNAISKWTEMHHRENSELTIRNLDAAYSILKHIGRNKIGYLNFAYDITPHCDCADYGDTPMVPDIGIFASKDPVAIDKATSDAILNAPGLRGSAAEDIGAVDLGEDKFSALSKWPPFEVFKTEDQTRLWKIQFEIGEKLGLGTQEYDLIKIS
ncbi:MAG: DUF362 domain-containing protein [Candidatus Bathyarchaeia archaeon]